MGKVSRDEILGLIFTWRDPKEFFGFLTGRNNFVNYAFKLLFNWSPSSVRHISSALGLMLICFLPSNGKTSLGPAVASLGRVKSMSRDSACKGFYSIISTSEDMTREVSDVLSPGELRKISLNIQSSFSVINSIPKLPLLTMPPHNQPGIHSQTPRSPHQDIVIPAPTPH